MTWNGETRRVSDANLEYRLSQLEEKMNALECKIDTLLKIWEQSQGAWKAVKLFFYITAPVVAVVVWIKDHVKL